MTGTPLPGSVDDKNTKSHLKCRYPDGEILMEDVRQQRKRRWWTGTSAIVLVAGSLITIFVLIFRIGVSMGASEQRMNEFDKQFLNAQQERNETNKSQVDLSRENADRYEKIQETLHSIDNRISKIEVRLPEKEVRVRYRR